MKKYNEDNKEYIKEYKKNYNENNKEQIVETKKKWYENNKEQILEKKKEKVTCECGCMVSKRNLVKHQKTNKHLELIQ